MHFLAEDNITPSAIKFRNPNPPFPSGIAHSVSLSVYPVVPAHTPSVNNPTVLVSTRLEPTRVRCPSTLPSLTTRSPTIEQAPLGLVSDPARTPGSALTATNWAMWHGTAESQEVLVDPLPRLEETTVRFPPSSSSKLLFISISL